MVVQFGSLSVLGWADVGTRVILLPERLDLRFIVGVMLLSCELV
jgi:hypothetical protein